MTTETITPIFGTNDNDRLQGQDRSEIFSGRAGNDVVYAANGADIAYGGSGDDKLHGSAGNDILYGGGGPKFGDLGNFVIKEDYKATVTFLSEGAGYQNSFGIYDIDPETNEIVNIEVLFANASAAGSGGDLVGGESATYVPLQAGEKLGFFIVSNGYGKAQNQALLDDKDAQWKLVDADGKPATAETVDPILVHVDAESGTETDIVSQFGKSLFHSNTTPGSESPMNVDGMSHTVGKVNPIKGTVILGFEDIKGGGDEDYDDLMIELEIGVTNAVAWLDGDKVKDDGIDTGTGTDVSENDVLFGGSGFDELYGMAGNDYLNGGGGKDLLYGNSGDDKLYGGGFHDTLHGGKGNDLLDGGTGHDIINGNSGDDTIIPSRGDDTINGGSGIDTLDASGSGFAMKVNLHSHKVTGQGRDYIQSVENVVGSEFSDEIRGDKRDNVIEGGAGDDWIRSLGGNDTLTGGEGADTFFFASKDASRDNTVDVITDFNINEDVLDLHKALAGATEANVQQYVEVTVNGDDLEIACDFDGVGGDFQDVCVLEGMGAFTIDNLIENDAIIL